MSRVHDLITTAHGQCRLAYVSATQLKLLPFKGSNLAINRQVERVPAAGVTLANTGLSANTVYYVYAYMSGTTMTLEASATGYTISDDGIAVKTGDATRTLVGMCLTNGSSQFADGGTRVGVLSYYNRRVKQGRSWFTTARSTSSTTAAELDAEIRVTFITWNDELARCRMNGGCYVGTTGPAYLYIGVDTNSQSDSGGWVNQTSQVPIAGEYSLTVSEGASHFATIYGIAAAGGTVGMTGNASQAAGQCTSLTVDVMG